VDDCALEDLNKDATRWSEVRRLDAWTDEATRVERFALGNGLVVIVWEDHSAPVFAYQTWLRVGSRHEERGRTGMAHLFEHMMFKATKHHPEGEFDTLMEAHGAQTNAATWVDWTYYREKLPAGNLELVCELEADRLQHLILNEAQLESEREVVKNERLMRVDNDPEGKLNEELCALAFETHGYGWPTIGWMEDIEAISLEDCLRFYGTYYSPNNAVIVVVGAVETRTVLATIQRHYGAIPPREIPPERVVVEPPITAERRRVLRLPLSAPKVTWAFHAPAAGDPRYATAEVLSEVLAGGESSRLYKTLVTDLELASEVGGWVASWAQPGLLEVGVTLHADSAIADVERVLEAELERLRREPITERELHKAIHSLEAGNLRGAGDTGTRARRLGHAEATVGDYRAYWHHQAALRRVRPDDVRALAAEVLRPDGRVVVIGEPAEAA